MIDAPRKPHYGAGRQPWDDILDSGWAPEFAAGNILKYLRRDKQREHSIESARWYHARLWEMTRGELLPDTIRESVKESAQQRFVGRSAAVLVRLQDMLTVEEKKLLEG